MNPIRKYIDIVKNPIQESASEDVLKSLLGLVKNNDGKFKSEKQANFLMSKTENGVFTTTTVPVSYGSSNRANPTVTWDIYLDNGGVKKVTKSTVAKGASVYWERSEEYINANKEKLDRKKESNASEWRKEIQVGQKIVADTDAEIEQIKTELADTVKEIQGKLSPDRVERIVKSFQADINEKMAIRQQGIDRIERAKSEMAKLGVA